MKASTIMSALETQAQQNKRTFSSQLNVVTRRFHDKGTVKVFTKKNSQAKLKMTNIANKIDFFRSIKANFDSRYH